MAIHNNQQVVFFELLKAGLWEKEVSLSAFSEIDYSAILRIAEEQSVVGLITAGLEQVKDVKVSQEWALQFIGSTLQIEQRNRAMNEFVANLIVELRKNDIYAILVKGQGIAQCYARPLWRACGDVDLFLSYDNYKAAKGFMSSSAVMLSEEIEERLHSEYELDSFIVELHGSLKTGLWYSVENVLESVQQDIFYGGEVRSWKNGQTQVFLPSPDNDVIIIFTHILQHFFVEGIGLRQICDWCRFLWMYRDRFDSRKLERRIKKSGLMREWKAFASLAVDYLGFPKEAMPLYDESISWTKKGARIMALILDTGNFGQKRDKSYKIKYPFLIRIGISFYRHTKDAFRRGLLFPLDSFRIWSKVMVNGVRI